MGYPVPPLRPLKGARVDELVPRDVMPATPWAEVLGVVVMLALMVAAMWWAF